MSDYRVNLDVFAGPLDLLLFLVRKEEVDIYDIPLAKITDQYVRYIEMLQDLNIDLACDFLVMAATLIQIKSAMLLPKADIEETADETLVDPRAELIRQLLEYKKFKDAANLLNEAADEQKTRFNRPASIIQMLKPTTEPELDLEQVSVWDLLEAFDNILKATGATFDISHISDDTPIDLYQIEILSRLQEEGAMSFGRIFEGKKSRIVMVGMFLAMLELIRGKLMRIDQHESGGDLFVRSLTDEPAAEAVRKAILSTAEEEAQRTAQASQAPAVPIVELPAKSEMPADTVPEAAEEMPDELPVPIAEIPAVSPSTTVAGEGELPPEQRLEIQH